MSEDPVNPYKSPNPDNQKIVNHTTVTLGDHVVPAVFVGLCGMSCLLELLMFAYSGSMWDLALAAINGFCVFTNVNTIMNTETTTSVIYDDRE